MQKNGKNNNQTSNNGAVSITVTAYQSVCLYMQKSWKKQQQKTKQQTSKQRPTTTTTAKQHEKPFPHFKQRCSFSADDVTVVIGISGDEATIGEREQTECKSLVYTAKLHTL